MDKKITIVKTDSESPPPKAPVEGKKSLKTFPRGVLKRTSKLHVKGVADPAKPPPMKQGMKKHTLKMFTSKGLSKHRKTMKQKIKKMKPEELDKLMASSNLKLSPNTPKKIKDQIVENAVSAGFLSM
jgi:hypothetical protein